MNAIPDSGGVTSSSIGENRPVVSHDPDGGRGQEQGQEQAAAQIDEAIVRLSQFVTRVRRFKLLRAATGLPFDRAAVIILRVLADAQPLRPNQLAAELDVKPPHVTRKLTGLVDLGYVRRLPDPDDRRACLVELTPSGEAAVTQIRKVSTTAIREALVDWRPGDVERFAEALQLMVADYVAHADSRFDRSGLELAGRSEQRPRTA